MTTDGKPLHETVLPQAVLPGSFNPLHDGHRQLAACVARLFCRTVHFELSRINVDKPPLDEYTIARRVQQFQGYAPVWLTNAPTFETKLQLFPTSWFILGYDTAVRLLEDRYYRDRHHRNAVLDCIAERGTRVIVGGRIDRTGQFRRWEQRLGDLPQTWRELFIPLSEADFRVDLSSTDLREQAADNGLSSATGSVGAA
jgi:hypothetical protein